MKALSSAHLAGPKLTVFALALAVGLTLPALRAGLIADDYFQREVLLGTGAGAGTHPVFDLYSFIPVEPHAPLDVSVLRWWTAPGIRCEFFRPLSALTFVFDYALWPNAFWLQHLQSLAWFGLGVFLVARFYRDLHGVTAVAGLAAILFAVDDAHAMCAGWLANRHALVSLVFGIAALDAHRRWRTGEGAFWGYGAVGLLALALLAGEAGVAAAAYIAAWQLILDRCSWPRKLVALLPAAIVVVAWRLAYDRLGYGAEGSGIYLDPANDPIAFARALAERWPVLQGTLWFRLPTDLWIAFSNLQRFALVLLSVVLLAVLAIPLAAVLRESREARFWALGTSLSLIPLCAAFPMDRLLLFSGIGAFPLIALLAERSGLLGGSVPAAVRSGRTLAAVLLFLHGPIAAILLPIRVAAVPWFGNFTMAGGRNLAADENAREQTFIFVGGHEVPVYVSWVSRRLERPEVAPARVEILATLAQPVRVRREDGDTLAISAAGGFLENPMDRLLREVDAPFRAGEKIERPDFTAEVRSITRDGRPVEVAFHFRTPLEDPHLRWLTWTETGPQPFLLPSVGNAVEIAPISLGGLLLRIDELSDVPAHSPMILISTRLARLPSNSP